MHDLQDAATAVYIEYVCQYMMSKVPTDANPVDVHQRGRGPIEPGKEGKGQGGPGVR